MKLSDFYYDLPQELIAQEPVKERSASRLLVLDRNTGELEHKVFSDIVDYIDPGDCLVLNDTRVIPARIYGKRKDTGGAIEFLLIRMYGSDTWEVMAKPGRRAKPGAAFSFGDGILEAQVLSVSEGGNRYVGFKWEGDRRFEEVLEQVGTMPLPPYIRKRIKDPERYQTVYARHRGSIAAPTAGLHFTAELLEKLKSKGVNLAYLTLHVGLGTFKPVKTEDISQHKMHSEYYHIGAESCQVINSAKMSGKRVITVGTTSCRVLETVADEKGLLSPGSGMTDIFIYPGYAFKAIDALITNFHLPQSTLIMLVCAFAGQERIFKAYQKAIEERYRFFSFGDAMFIK